MKLTPKISRKKKLAGSGPTRLRSRPNPLLWLVYGLHSCRWERYGSGGPIEDRLDPFGSTSFESTLNGLQLMVTIEEQAGGAMLCYHLPVTQRKGKDGITLTVRTRGGRIIATAGGPTRADAEKRLRQFINEVLVGRVEDGLNPLSLLRHGEPGPGAVNFDELDLYPIVLRSFRRDSGITQAAMAERMGVTQAAYSKLEQVGANPTLGTIRRLQRALGKPMIRFLVG